MTNTEKAIRKIKEDGVDEIIEIAIDNFVEGYNSIVFFDPEDNTFSGRTWTSGTYLNPNSRLEEVFRIDGNWIANSSWEVDDMLDDAEYEALKKAVAKKEGITDEDDIEYAADFLDAEKLSLIDVNFNERLKDYLNFCDIQGEIIEKMEET